MLCGQKKPSSYQQQNVWPRIGVPPQNGSASGSRLWPPSGSGATVELQMRCGGFDENDVIDKLGFSPRQQQITRASVHPYWSGEPYLSWDSRLARDIVGHPRLVWPQLVRDSG